LCGDGGYLHGVPKRLHFFYYARFG
jgi:hypothetical protein